MLSGARAFTCTLFGKRVILLGHRKSLRYVLIVVARMPSLSLLSALLSHTQCDARSYVPRTAPPPAMLPVPRCRPGQGYDAQASRHVHALRL